MGLPVTFACYVLAVSVQDLVNDLWEWGARSTREVEQVYGAETVKEALKQHLLLKRRVGPLYIYILSGRRLTEYGITVRYKYVPARATLVGTLLLRYGIAKAQAEGWKNPVPYRGYSQGHQNIALLKKENQVLIILGRATIARRTLYLITDHFLKETDIRPERFLFYINTKPADGVTKLKMLEDRHVELHHFTLNDLKQETPEAKPPGAQKTS